MMKRLLCIVIMSTLCLLVACGEPEEDVSVFIMPNSGIFNETVAQIQETVSERLGDSLTVAIYGSTVFRHEKLMVEVAAGQHDLFIVSENQLHAYAAIDGITPIDDYYEADRFPEGVISVDVTERIDGETV